MTVKTIQELILKLKNYSEDKRKLPLKLTFDNSITNPKLTKNNDKFIILDQFHPIISTNEFISQLEQLSDEDKLLEVYVFDKFNELTNPSTKMIMKDNNIFTGIVEGLLITYYD